MDNEFLFKLEKEFFLFNHMQVVPELLKEYFEGKEYPLVYYISDMAEASHYYDEQAVFYKLLSAKIMDRPIAESIVTSKNYEQWCDICRDYNIYWKHILLFLLSQNLTISEMPDWFVTKLDNYNSNPLVRFAFLCDNMKRCNEKITNKQKELLCSKYDDLLGDFPFLTDYFMKQFNPSPDYRHDDSLQMDDAKKYIYAMIHQNEKRKSDLVAGSSVSNMVKVFANGDITVFSYKPFKIAASMHIVSDGENTIIFDCGAEIIDSTVMVLSLEELFDSINLELSSLQGVFISHAHLDHCGSLESIPFNIPIYTNTDTSALMQLAHKLDLGFINIHNYYETVTIGKFKITSIPNGHICGSVLYDTVWDTTFRFVYTGDFSMHEQQTVKALRMEDLVCSHSKKVDLLITETTNGHKIDVLTYEEYKRIFKYICERLVLFDKKVLIPCFAIGRSQEISLLLKENNTETIKIVIDGVAAETTKLYQWITGLQIFQKNIQFYEKDMDILDKIHQGNIFLVSSGLLARNSSSFNYFTKLRSDYKEQLVILKVGFISEAEPAMHYVNMNKADSLQFFDIPLSAHADYKSVLKLIFALRPDHLVFVHGKGLKV